MARILAATFGLILFSVIGTHGVFAAQQCVTQTSLTCEMSRQCPEGMISFGCKDGRRKCCTPDNSSPPGPTTGGGSIGGNIPYAGCEVGGVLRKDIKSADCREAQTSGCIRRLLTESQYYACLRAQKPAKASGCMVAGVNRTDIGDSDCKEAQTTGCIRRLLTPTQYSNCLKAQKH
jgi:hypothetical protein